MPTPEQRFEVPPEYAEVYERAYRRAYEEGRGILAGPGADSSGEHAERRRSGTHSGGHVGRRRAVRASWFQRSRDLVTEPGSDLGHGSHHAASEGGHHANGKAPRSGRGGLSSIPGLGGRSRGSAEAGTAVDPAEQLISATLQASRRTNPTNAVNTANSATSSSVPAAESDPAEMPVEPVPIPAGFAVILPTDRAVLGAAHPVVEAPVDDDIDELTLEDLLADAPPSFEEPHTDFDGYRSPAQPVTALETVRRPTHRARRRRAGISTLTPLIGIGALVVLLMLGSFMLGRITAGTTPSGGKSGNPATSVHTGGN